jgi:hypothetical protein
MSKRKGQAKLTSAIVEAIRNAKEWRGIVTALAIQYGVSHSMISMIRAGKRWTADPMTEERFKPRDARQRAQCNLARDLFAAHHWWRYADDGDQGDCRRDMAQRLGALLESNAIEMEAKWIRSIYQQWLASSSERAAFRGTLQIESHGRELSEHETRRVAERAWQNFLRYGWLMHTTPH